MTVPDHDMRELFFDVAGQPMKAAAFRKRYPKRLLINATTVRGVVVRTEFVGINHNSERGRIKIYETTVHVSANHVHVYTSWSSSLLWARATQLFTMVRAWVGAAELWRLLAARARAKARGE